MEGAPLRSQLESSPRIAPASRVRSSLLLNTRSLYETGSGVFSLAPASGSATFLGGTAVPFTEVVVSDKLKHCSLIPTNKRGIAVPARGIGAAQLFTGSRDI
jgi:hypothetical protein